MDCGDRMRDMLGKDNRGELRAFRSFKFRLLLVIFLVAFAGLAMQSGKSSRNLVEPVIKYILTDYGVEQKLADWLQEWRQQLVLEDPVPVEGNSSLRIPCDYVSIERGYGWQWSADHKKQEFNPGVHLKVKDNTLVKPVLEGRVVEISSNEDGRTVLLHHSDNLFSLYGGLKEILVEKDSTVQTDHILGKTGEHLYLEIRNREGPQNLQQLFGL